MAAFDGFLDSRDAIASFYPRYAEQYEKSWRGVLAMTVPAVRLTETFRWIGQVGYPREWLGNRVGQTLNRFTMNITGKKWEQSIDILRDDLRRDQTGFLMARVGDFAKKAAIHPERLLETLMVNADSTTSGLCYDGQQFVDTDHSEGDSGTQTNDLTATEIPSANVTTTTAPTPSEMSNILVEAIGYFMQYKDDKGDANVNGDASEFVVTCGTNSIYSAVVQAVGLNRLASGADNPLDGMKKLRSINVTPLLLPGGSPGTAGIQVYRTDALTKPYIYMEEKPLTTDFLGEGTEYATLYDKHFFGTNAIYNVGFGEWRYAMEIQFS